MEALFEITCTSPAYGRDTAYAEDPEGAHLAYWTLRKDAGTMGSVVKVTNLATGLVVWNEEV